MRIEIIDNKLTCNNTVLYIMDYPVTQAYSPEHQLFIIASFLTHAYANKIPRAYTIYSHSGYGRGDNYPKYGAYTSGSGPFIYANPLLCNDSNQRYYCNFDIKRIIQFINHIGQFFDLRSELAAGYLDSLNAKR